MKIQDKLTMFLCMLAVFSCDKTYIIDREALVRRNNPHVSEINPLYSLTVGNGRFAFTADATGLQTFPGYYRNGLSLGTFSEWGWHSYPDTAGYKVEETLHDHPLPGHPHGIYSVQNEGGGGRYMEAASWYRANPHRMHLAHIGFESMGTSSISGIDQTLDMWEGVLHSRFVWKGDPIEVSTSCHGEKDIVSAEIHAESRPPVVIRFSYPDAESFNDCTDYSSEDRHSTEIVAEGGRRKVIRRTVDESVYYVELTWEGDVDCEPAGRHALRLRPNGSRWSFSVGFYEDAPASVQPSYRQCLMSSGETWKDYWSTSGVIDFSRCTDPRAPLLERRVILSQYLLRSQEVQHYPAAETGLTYNTWYGKFHLEMVMWHSFHYALWNKPEYLEPLLLWYRDTAMPKAAEIAGRQGFEGVRWMKMTDPSAEESPSNIGSFLIWQQPHVIYMAELVYRVRPSEEFLREYADVIFRTAEFMASFVNYDEQGGRYVIQGACAANESYDEESTLNPAFEVAYWHFGLGVAQKWRERLGLERNARWDEIMAGLPPLATSPDGIYLPAEKSRSIPDFQYGIPGQQGPAAPAGGFSDGIRPQGVTDTGVCNDGRDPFYVTATSSENLLAFGMLPESPLIDLETMNRTLDRAVENWEWEGGSWSWNYPSLCMNATRLLRSDVAIRAITMDGRDDLLLPSGHNYRSSRLRIYLPGNGGLLMAVAMMCAGWDGCTTENPGFPKDGTWDVHWEGLSPMP